MRLRFELLAFEMLKKVPGGMHELIRNSSHELRRVAVGGTGTWVLVKL